MGFLDSIFNVIGQYSGVIGSVTQGISSISSYMDQRDAEKQTRKGNEAMMAAAQQEAQLSAADAQQKAMSIRRDAARLRSQQITSYLKSGVTLDGSPMLVTDETTELGKQDAANTITNSAYQQKALLLKAQANKQTVKKADFFGTAFKALGSFGDAYNSLKAIP